MRYRFRIEYDGTHYAGWQRQPGVRTIQTELERAFSVVTRFPCSVTGAGRTDAGVHAAGQGGHFDIPERVDTTRVCRSVNAILPPDIAVREVCAVDDAFHARYSARARRYRYRLTLRKTPLMAGRAWYVAAGVDWDRVRHELQPCCGTHDFTTFCCADTATKSMRCTLRRVEIHDTDIGFDLVIEADRFVYRMVRSLTGTLVDMGRGRLAYGMAHALAARDRSLAGTTAPAHGLELEYVTYDEDRL